MTTVLFEIEFYLLILCSLLLPCGIYATMLFKRTISQWTVLLLAIILMILSGVDFVLLQKLATKAKLSTSLFDDLIFNTEVAIALYVLPATFAGIGINLISHVLIRHLNLAESRFSRQQKADQKEDHIRP